MKIAITGGSGGIGRAITRVALAAGHLVVSIDRVEPAERLAGVTYVLGEVADYDLLTGSFAGCDAVIEASFFGTTGGVSLKNVGGSFYDFEGLRYRGTKTETVAAPPDAWGEKALLNWIRKLSINSDFNAEAEQYLKSAEVLDKIYES